MKRLRNPFLLAGFYGPEYFCDREKALATLHTHYRNERNIVLYSWRRMGKTALIKYFTSILEREKQAETLYVDLLGTRDLPSAIKQITRSVYERFGKTSSGITGAFQRLLGRIGAELKFNPYDGTPSISIEIVGFGPIERSLEEIGSFLDNRKHRVLVTLDELQKITSYRDENGEAIFRSWMQSFPAIRFIFSGSHRQMMRSMFSGKNRPFYRSTQLQELGPISLDSYSGFIRDHFEKSRKKIDYETIKQLYEWSRSQTYCIQLVCNRLFGSFNSVNPNQLQTVYSEILDQESTVFSSYTKLLTDLQYKVLMAIAKEEPLANPLSKEFIAGHDLGAASSVSSALEMLVKNELVIRDEGKYLVHDVLLSRWLQSL